MTAVNGINSITLYELQRLQTNSNAANTLYQAEDGTIFNGNGYAVSAASGETCTDGKDDGKLTFMEGLKNFGKGLVSPITNMFKSPKNFLVGALTIAAGAGIIALTGGAAAPIFVAAGATMGTIQIGTGLYKAATATTDAEAKDAWQGVGSGTFAVAASVAGAKSAAKAAHIEGAENMTALQATKACFKAAPGSVKTSFINAGSKISGFVSSKFAAKSTELATIETKTSTSANATSEKAPIVDETRFKVTSSDVKKLPPSAAESTTPVSSNPTSKALAQVVNSVDDAANITSATAIDPNVVKAQSLLTQLENEGFNTKTFYQIAKIAHPDSTIFKNLSSNAQAMLLEIMKQATSMKPSHCSV